LRGGFVEGLFLRRLNRFLVQVQVHGRLEEAFLPNSGRLEELLVPGNRALLRVVGPQGGRRTSLDLWGIFTGRIWVCVDSRMANELLPEAVREGLIGPLKGVDELQREVPFEGRRLDFLASKGVESHWVEAKSVTLVEGGKALFPDAPTERGREHVVFLREIVKRGERAGIVFMVLREDAEGFSPHWARDPLFSEALKESVKEGVWVWVLRFRVGRGRFFGAEPIPVELG